jgi:NTP pyrophosphatase (non-canonical NTP hydrolase)
VYALSHKLPLNGIRVLDFTWVGAGPLTTRVLAEYGAEVIKIESGTRLDYLRLLPPYKDGKAGVERSGYFSNRNPNKKGISLNLKNRRALEIIKELIKFRNERDWEQFHNPKDLALAINIEAGELLELFLWKSAEDANKEKVKEELADVFAFAFLLADKYKFDVKQIVLDKIKQNGEKYPVDKSKGTATKYNEL